MSHASLHRDAIVVLREWAAPTPEQETLREGFIRLLTRGVRRCDSPDVFP
ncbi:MAG: hypothetical protein R2693_04135 [Nocardioidaceae bacterium]